MNATENTFQGIALLEDNELLIGQLYRQFAAIFPKQVRLWSELSLDEMIHARMLRGLRSRLPATNGGLNGKRFDLGSLSTFRDFMKSMLYGTLETEMPAQSALNTAIYIQWSLMEQESFQMSEKDPFELRAVLQTLAAGTCKQRDRLLKALKKAGKVPSGSLSVVGTNGSEGRSFVPSPCEEFNHLGFFPLDS